MDTIIGSISWIIVGLPLFIIAGSVHEYMHAYVAMRLGDDTAANEGRLTLNPISHIDPWGLLLIVFVGFGWMKPVPVNPYNFRNPVRDMALVAAAGPFSNLIMAGSTAAIIRGINLLPANTELVTGFMSLFVYMNIILMVFNLIPIPPLDGSRIIRVILPTSMLETWNKIEDYSFIILIAFFFVPPLSILTSSLLSGATSFIYNILL